MQDKCSRLQYRGTDFQLARTTWVLGNVSNSLDLFPLTFADISPYCDCVGLVRFTPKSDSSKILIGQPSDENVDVGVAVREGKEVSVDVFSGTSILSPGESSGQSAVIGTVLSPLTQVEAGAIRCIGLNVSTRFE